MNYGTNHSGYHDNPNARADIQTCASKCICRYAHMHRLGEFGGTTFLAWSFQAGNAVFWGGVDPAFYSEPVEYFHVDDPYYWSLRQQLIARSSPLPPH